MKVVQMPGKIAADYIVGEDEEIICRNATIICDLSGQITAWVDNDKMMPVVITEDDPEE